MKKNRASKPKNDFIKNRQSLINKISDALSLKYNNFFTAANYSLQALKEDVGNLLSTQYYDKDPRDVFKPIETNILDIVKQKNPNLQVKVKKARKLPEIKYTKDKYQEADEVEKHVEKEKEKDSKKNKNNNGTKKPVSMGKRASNNRLKNGIEKNKSCTKVGK